MHGVGFDRLGFDGSKGAGADVQKHVGMLDGAGAEPCEQFVGEVEAGGGRGNGAGVGGEGGLIPAAVIGIGDVEVGAAACGEDVGREGGEAHALEGVGRTFDADKPRAGFVARGLMEKDEADTGGRSGGVVEFDEGILAEATGLEHDFPGVRRRRAKVEALDGASGAEVSALEAGGEDAGGVEDEEVVRAEEVGEVGDAGVDGLDGCVGP